MQPPFLKKMKWKLEYLTMFYTGGVLPDDVAVLILLFSGMLKVGKHSISWVVYS